MPQTRARAARQARGAEEPEDEEKRIADGWNRGGRTNSTWFKIMDIIPYHRKVNLGECMGGDPESAAAVDRNYGNLR